MTYKALARQPEMFRTARCLANGTNAADWVNTRHERLRGTDDESFQCRLA